MKILKFFLFVLTITFFFLTTLPIYFFLFVSPHRARKTLILEVSFYSKIMLRILGINVSFKGGEFPEENCLIVSNHLSYLDVIVLASKIPTAFVTSKEIKKTPFLGEIVKLAGCLFVDRKNRSNLKEEISELKEGLLNGLNVTVFPEATSTNGDEVLRFRRPLFEAAKESNKNILPLTINYKTISHKEVSSENRDIVCWYGLMDFLPHFLKLLEEKEVSVEVSVGELISPYGDSLELAKKSHEIISLSFISLHPMRSFLHDQIRSL